MSVTHTSSESGPTDVVRCKRCNTPLPAHATFCGTCGERVTTSSRTLPDTGDIAERYRMTSLIRRRPPTQLFRASDTQQQRPVVIRDIDISELSGEKQDRAVEAAQKEYDLLRRERLTEVTPVVDLRFSKEHLYLIAAWTASNSDAQESGQTLDDLLQSGIGLPDEQTAMRWTYRLCRALIHLHSHNIVIGDLDPHTIVVNSADYKGIPALMISWLPQAIQELLPPTSVIVNTNNHFSAPEALLGKAEPRSDIYSLGAILYLLLTGRAPDDATQRKQRALRTPREINPQIKGKLDELVMQALSLDSAERFQSAEEMNSRLLELSSNARIIHHRNSRKEQRSDSEPERQDDEVNDPDDVTISVAPIQAQLARWYLSKVPTGQLEARAEAARQELSGTQSPEESDDISTKDTQAISMSGSGAELPKNNAFSIKGLPEPLPRQTPLPEEDDEVPPTTHTGQFSTSFKDRISSVLPALPRLSRPAGRSATVQGTQAQPDESFLKRLQRFVLGEQQHRTTAAALIETPLRIQPNQSYVLRIHLMGRDMPTPVPGAKKGAPSAGLSALVQGEQARIEVRSALYQNYAYIVQRADVRIPAKGFAAEVTIPMQAIATSKGARRERLHIFFMDEAKRPLYEKPFVIELFISRLVQAGREGHNVLTIPL